MLKILLILSCITELRTNILNTKNTIGCNIEDENFWKIYRWHFGNATSIMIISLENSHVYNVREFLTEFLHHLYLHRLLTKTFTIKRYVLIEEENDNNYFNIKYDDCECKNKTISNKTDLFQTVLVYKNFIRFQRMKRYSCDPETAFLIISWDETDLEKFIDHSYNIFPKPRGSFMIIFVSPSGFDEIGLKKLFQKIWKKLGVLNIIFRRFCSDNKLNYIFNPFGKVEEEYGILRNFSGEDEMDNFVNIMRNLNGYPVDVSLFARIPTAVKPVPRLIQENIRYNRLLYKSNDYGGLDGTVLSTLSDYLNFFPIIHTPPSDMEYGYMEPNGTFVGSLGDVISRTVAISFNGRFITNYNTTDIEFTTPVSNDMVCLVVPSAEKIPQWLKIFRCFTIDAWLGIFGLYLLSTLYWYGLKPIDFRKRFRLKRNCFPAFEIYSFFVSASVRMPTIDSHRVFFAFCMLFNIILTGTFQSSLVTSFTTTTYYPNTKTLRQFDETGLKIGTSSITLSETFNSESPSVLYKSLGSKIVILNATSTMPRAAYKRDMAAIERNADARMRIKTQFTEPDGFELLHVVKECPRSYYVSYIVSKGSPYFKVFNHVLTMFREAGLLNKWSLDTVDAYIAESRKIKRITNSKAKVFTLYDIQTAFYLLLLGLSLSFIIFLIELCFIKKKIKK